MSKIIAVDFGQSQCGLAQSTGEVAAPLGSVPTKKIFEHLSRLEPHLVVVGISEGAMAQKTLLFVKRIREMLNLPVETVDETLTSQEARGLDSRTDEHALAAALILTRYLENHPAGNV